MLRISRKGRRLQVSAPYDERFVKFARSIGGKWRYRSKMWSFLAVWEPQIRRALYDIYGYIAED